MGLQIYRLPVWYDLDMVQVRLMGTLKEAAGRKSQSVEDCTTVGSVISTLIEYFGEEFRKVILDPMMNSPLPNALILVNGVEINNLKGLDTTVSENDDVVLLSVTHGG